VCLTFARIVAAIARCAWWLVIIIVCHAAAIARCAWWHVVITVCQAVRMVAIVDVSM
jgi:hypothetical protein